MKLRDKIALTRAEQEEYVATSLTLTLCTHGPGGYPHAVAMWFAVDDEGILWMTTYRKSQKALNVRRNPKVALLIESGVTYETLKGMLIRGEAEVIDDEETALRTMLRVTKKMLGAIPDGAEDEIRIHARKRVALKVTPKRVSSWDHSKLAGSR